jgi:hypothetical protein
MNSIDINIITDNFYDNQIKMNLVGTVIKYNSKKYLITVHHNLPIYLVKYKNANLNVLIDSSWNELLVLENKNIENIKVHNNFCYILKSDINIYIIKDNYKIMFNNISYEFIQYNNLESGQRVPYITANMINDSLIENKNYLVGMSGCPVYYKDKLIGIFSRFNITNNKIYIIPMIVIIKTLLKRDNNKICILNKKVKKIDYYNIDNNQIFYKSLNIFIPIETYYLLEGNLNNNLCLLDNNEIVLFSKTFDEISVNNKLEIVNNNYKLDYRLLTLLHKLQITKNIKIFISYINTNETVYINKELKIKI